MTATTETLTIEMTKTLRDEAASAGDLEMVKICDAALDNNERAIRKVVAAINDARGRDDGPFVGVIVPAYCSFGR